MGMQFHDDGKLYVLDAYNGLYRVDVDTGEWEHLAGGEQKIGGQRVRLACDLAVARDGQVFWTDASTQVGPEDVLLELLAEPSGRLLSYDPRTNRTVTLIGNLHCATGVALSSDESSVLVAEAGNDRLLRYHLTGPETGKWDVFVEGLPGVPVKLQRHGDDGYMVTLAVQHPSVLLWLRQHPTLGRAMMRLMFATEAAFSAVNSLVENHVSRDVLYMLGNPQLVAPFLHNSAVLILDSSGHIQDGLISDDYSLGVLSQAETVGDYVYLASPYNPYLGRLNLTQELRAHLQTNNNQTPKSLLKTGTPKTPEEPPKTSEEPPKTSEKTPVTSEEPPAIPQESPVISQNSEILKEDVEKNPKEESVIEEPEPEEQTTMTNIEEFETTEVVEMTNQPVDLKPLEETLETTEEVSKTESSEEKVSESPEVEDTTLSNQVEQFATSDSKPQLLNLKDLIVSQV